MCKDQTLLDNMISHLKTASEVTVGDADVYVGLHITRTFASHILYVDQQRFTETPLLKHDFKMRTLFPPRVILMYHLMIVIPPFQL